MLTVLDAIKKSTEYLEKKGIESPRMNAELLLSEILKCKRLELYLAFDRPLDKIEIDKYREYIARRGKFEPLQYITGYVEFLDMTLKVNSDVLIPRQETELLVEKALKLCKEKKLNSILEIGTGSGNIALGLAKGLNGVVIKSIDNSEAAIKVAQENAKLNNIEAKIDFIQQDIFEYNSNEKFDLIISNPPYVSNKDYNKLQKEIVDYEPLEAVSDLSDGYKFYDHIITKSFSLLSKKGILIFELAEGQSEAVENMLQINGFTAIEIVKDYQGIDRIIFGEKE